MSFSKERYVLACSRYAEQWSALDNHLYDLCRNHPAHQTKAAINAKIWIISRTYATGIERKVASQGTQGSSLEQLAAHFWNNRRAIDAVVCSLNGVREPLTADMLETVLTAHARFIRTIQRPLRIGQTPRSFVSKYLHFHNPAVPIYDSIAAQAAKRHYRKNRGDVGFPVPPEADSEYADYLQRFWRLYSDAQQAQVTVSVKLLDNYLLTLAKEDKGR